MSKISTLPAAASPLTGTEQVVLLQNGQTRQGPIGALIEGLAQPYVNQAKAARDVAIAAGVQYPNVASAVASLADGGFGSYLDDEGLPVWGQRDGASMVPITGAWFDADKVGYGSGSVGRALTGRINLANTELALDGTDESAAAQAVFSTLKGKALLIPAGKTLCAAGIYMNGDEWNGTDLLVEGEFKLSPAPSLEANNGFGQVWSGIEVRNCSVKINGNFFGDRTNQQQREQTIMIAVAGGHIKSEIINFRELRGDGLYITQSEYNVASDDPTFDLGAVYAINSEIDGRNPVTVISCERGSLGSLVCRNFGRVNGNLQPGGLDFEPNYSGQKVRNVSVGFVDIDGVGQAPLQIFGGRYSDFAKTTIDPNVYDADITIGYARIINRTPPDVNDGNGNPTHTNQSGCLIEGVRGVHIGWLDVKFTEAYGNPLNVRGGAADITIRGRGRKSSGASFGGLVTIPTRKCENLNIAFDVDDVSRYGHYIQVARNSTIGGKITNPSGAYFSSRFAVIVEPNGSLSVDADITGTRLCQDIPGDAEWTRAWRHGGNCTYTDAVIDGARQIGNWDTDLSRAGDMRIRRSNSRGLTDADAKPNGGYWLAGDVVRNLNAGALGELEAWLRMTNGSSHAAGVDWRATGASIFVQETVYDGTLFHTATDETQLYSGALPGAAIGDIITVAPRFNPMQCSFRGVIPAANTLRIFGINQSAADQAFANPSFTIEWRRG